MHYEPVRAHVTCMFSSFLVSPWSPLSPTLHCIEFVTLLCEFELQAHYEPVEPVKHDVQLLVSPLMNYYEAHLSPCNPVHCNTAFLRICCHCSLATPFTKPKKRSHMYMSARYESASAELAPALIRRVKVFSYANQIRWRKRSFGAQHSVAV